MKLFIKWRNGAKIEFAPGGTTKGLTDDALKTNPIPKIMSDYSENLSKGHTQWLRHEFQKAVVSFKRALNAYKANNPEPNPAQAEWIKELEGYVEKCRKRQGRTSLSDFKVKNR